MLNEALQLTLAGMSIVFAFLLIMVATIMLMSKIILKYFPEKEKTVAKEAAGDQQAIVAAILAAIEKRK